MVATLLSPKTLFMLALVAAYNILSFTAPSLEDGRGGERRREERRGEGRGITSVATLLSPKTLFMLALVAAYNILSFTAPSLGQKAMKTQL